MDQGGVILADGSVVEGQMGEIEQLKVAEGADEGEELHTK